MTRPRMTGFTLIEAAVAIAVVAILSGIVVPLVIKNITDSQVARARNDVQVIGAALASQLKDTGSRPCRTVSGIADGTLAIIWGSAGQDIATLPLTSATTTFTTLFTAPASGGVAPLTAGNLNALFATLGGQEFSYKGPYLAPDVAAKTDPWGSRYIVLGYDGPGQISKGPLWVVCAGPDRKVDALNNALSVTWSTVDGSGNPNTSADDLVLRVN